VRFQVLTAASMKMAVFWDVAPRCLVEIYWHFRAVNHSDDKAVTSFYQTTQRNIQEDSDLQDDVTLGFVLRGEFAGWATVSFYSRTMLVGVGYARRQLAETCGGHSWSPRWETREVCRTAS
jgi:hypothetical protein